MTTFLGLHSSDIYPAHRDKFDRWVQEHSPNPTIKNFNILDSSSSSRDREMGRIFRYYQHMGLLPREIQPESIHTEDARQTVSAISSDRIPGSRGDILAGTRLADDTLSIARNLLYVMPPAGWVRFITTYLGVGAGTLWSGLALHELGRGVQEHFRAKKIGDKEGEQRAQVRIGSGAFISGASLAYLGGEVCQHLGQAASLTSGLVLGANALFGVGSMLAMGSSVAGVLRCKRFCDRLDEYLRHPTLPLKDRMRGAVSFLKDSLSVTPEECEQIRSQIETDHPEWAPEQKETLFREKCIDLAETKTKYTKRRTSSQSLHQILYQADSILRKLDDPAQVDAGIRDATLLVYSVRKDNINKKILYCIGFLASLLSVLALLILVCLHLEMIAFALYGISGAMCLGMTVGALGKPTFNKNQFPKE